MFTEQEFISRGSRNIAQLNSVEQRTLLARQRSLISLIDEVPQNAIDKLSDYLFNQTIPKAVLFNPRTIDKFVEETSEIDGIEEFFVVAGDTKEFKRLRQKIEESVGPMTIEDQEMFTLADGSRENVAFFNLRFLEKDRIELGYAFKALVPLLWLKAGGRGSCAAVDSARVQDWFAPEDVNFAVLLEETRFSAFATAICHRGDLDHIFIVTDSEEAFRDMSREIQIRLPFSGSGIEIAQLYRDYLRNFEINFQPSDRIGYGEAEQ